MSKFNDFTSFLFLIVVERISLKAKRSCISHVHFENNIKIFIKLNVNKEVNLTLATCPENSSHNCIISCDVQFLGPLKLILELVFKFEVVTLFEGGEEYFLLPDYYTDQDGDEYKYGELQFNVEVNIIENEQEQNFVLDSTMGGEHDDTIYVDIVISPDFNDKDYESLQIVLSEYIRHEIEHILQTIDSDRPDIIDKDDTMSPFDYYSQQHEVDAQKVGFERRAKMEDKSVEEVIRDYLEYRQSIDNLSQTEKQELIGKLTN